RSQSQPQHRNSPATSPGRSGPRATPRLRLGTRLLVLGRRSIRLGSRALGANASRLLLGAGSVGRVSRATWAALAVRARALGARAWASPLLICSLHPDAHLNHHAWLQQTVGSCRGNTHREVLTTLGSCHFVGDDVLYWLSTFSG